MTKIYYVANVRMPTEKAHGLTIAKSCEAFGKLGLPLVLVIPRRRTNIAGTVFSAYDLESTFRVARLFTIDAIWWSGSTLAFILQSVTFYISVTLFFLFRSRSATVYTRDIAVLGLTLLGFRVVYECHHLFPRRGRISYLLRGADKIITISNALKRAFVELGFSESEIFVAPSGVDLSTFDIDVSKEAARNELDLPQEAKIAGYTGNFTTMGEDKGLHVVIAALKDAPGITFVAAGGSEKDIARYLAQAKDTGVAARVILHGYAPQKTLALYQKAADVLLMPFPDTPHYRNHMSPVKMFEYMASGTPIIASDLPTIREVLNERNAFLVQPGDPHALAGALNEAWTAADASVRAMQAHEEVQAFSWDARAARIATFCGMLA
jgi:glycosyltransferase involved in cell wall biosynthesis